ncbi:MAG: hypothetical protein PHQ91_11155 [Thermoanaerobaculaceae bacterium]|nr:hypothetical protein [Thermoanaerobaculaceae bacterium]TAM54908.1 MAG: hypothetical protein EPN53_03780 [Acidobacteriota bacterium]
MSARDDRRGVADAAPSPTQGGPAPARGGLRGLFHRPRILGEVRFAFGAALIMGVAGAAVAFGMPPLRLLATDTPAARLFVQGSVGFGLGWWGGLFWSTALVFHARRFRPLPPLAAMTTATWVAGTLLAATALVLRAAGATVVLSIGAGVVAATVAARLVVARAARRAGR